MTWRTVYISKQCHMSFKNNYLVVKSDEINQIHISEINTILIDSNMSTISTYLMNELVKAKVKVIICDEKHNPSFELAPYSVAFDSSRMISKMVNWDRQSCQELWSKIVEYKIKYQADMLFYANKDAYLKLIEYSTQIELDDITNREGHAAKVYFNSLFGSKFSREQECTINAYLDYGYTILLSMFNREIVNKGYITQVGIHHRGATNPFNLSCDLMEPFRPIVDRFAYDNQSNEFDVEKRKEVAKLMNKQIVYDGKKCYLTNVISTYVSKVLSNLETGILEERWLEYSCVED